MHPQLLELRPNRLLLDPKFEGYKLSLSEIPSVTQIFQTGVDTMAPNCSQFSYLHAKLHSEHNHLSAKSTDAEDDGLFFVNKNWEIVKVRIDPLINEFVEEIVWKVPKSREREPGDYNVKLKFASGDLAVVNDGGSQIVHILDTTKVPWVAQSSTNIEGISTNFVISDAIYTHKQLNLLLVSIVSGDSDKGSYSLISFVSFEKSESNWIVKNLKQFSSKGAIQYAYFDRNCKSFYIASDANIKKVGQIVESLCENGSKPQFKYQWSQKDDTITINIQLSHVKDIQKSLIVDVSCEETSLLVKYEDEIVISGELSHKIDREKVSWRIDVSSKVLIVDLQKLEIGLMWSELICGDSSGEYIHNQKQIEDSNLALNKLTGDVEVNLEMGLTFNSEEMEECDYESDKSTLIERFSTESLETTHRINLGSHQILFSVQLDENQAPAIAIRLDVDACIWQPTENLDNFNMEHVATLSALGYIQASKQQKRFFSCAPNSNYSVICESRKHLFIYRQNKSVEGGELKNRKTGKNVKVLAQQQVATLPTTTDDILGMHCTNSTLFALTENYIFALKLS